MNEGLKSTIGLIVKVLIILMLPLLFLRYVDTQPTAVVDDHDDEGTRSVAIVNEDTGVEKGKETMILGKEIPSLLGEQEDYSWKVVNRSAAEQGFSNQKYDAIIYVPSSFSENIMTFKEDEPTKAAINYVIQPNLEAKERQRVHREMANAKNKINQEMSTIYWSYVSQEIGNIREHFDTVLEKEVAFQDAMYSFYTPSSKTLATEIEQHKGSLENILNQTDQINDVSSTSVSSAADAESKMVQFTEALEAYKEAQQEQQQLLAAAQAENKEAIQAGVESYNKALEESIAAIENQFKQQSVVFADNKKIMTNRFGEMQVNINEGKEILRDWRIYKELRKEKQVDQFKQINEEIVKMYNGRILDERFKDANEQLDNAISKFGNAPINSSIIEPIAPKEFEGGEINLGTLRSHITKLEEAIEIVKGELVPKEATNDVVVDGVDDSDPGTEEPETGTEDGTSDVWDKVDNSFQDLMNELVAVESQYEDYEDPTQIIVEWKEYANSWKSNYEQLVEQTNDATIKIIENIKAKQSNILKSDALSSERKSNLKVRFDSFDNMNIKDLVSLVEYTEALSVYQTNLSQTTGLNEELIKEIVSNKQKEMDKLLEIDTYHADELRKLFGESTNQIRSSEVSFTDIIEDTENSLSIYSGKIQKEQEKATNLLGTMTNSANEITTQLQTVNAETFEWEESPSIQFLDGQMVFNIQKSAVSNLDQLSEMVASLDESQGNITSNTEELQSKVSNVQKQSDELNNRWSVNVASTEKVKDDVYDVLGNTVVDGQMNPFVYNYLSNPVEVEGQVNGKVLSETEDRMPPVIMFIIILISGLLIGFLCNYYSNNAYIVQGGLFLLLNLAVGLIISMYGLSIYSLDDGQAIMWSVFTILLLLACSNIVRAGLFIGPFVGWLASIAMIVFFITPLLNIVVPEFSFNNPISNVYMGLQYGTQSSLTWTLIVLAVIVLLASAFVYTLQIMKNRAKVEPNEEKAS